MTYRLVYKISENQKLTSFLEFYFEAATLLAMTYLCDTREEG
jgi:hypothetical protein